MSRLRVWCEFGADGRAIRIFRSTNAAVSSPAWDEGRVREYPRKNAVEEIRRQVFEKCNGECPLCGRPITWDSGHMDEEVSRGAGGEISIWNSRFICPPCHIGPQGKHSNRLPKWSNSGRIMES